jgi:hypothetical protein
MTKLRRVLVPLVVLAAFGCGKKEETVVPATPAKPADASAPATPPPPPADQPANPPATGGDNPIS